MKINYNIQGPKRKELVKLIADFTGYEAKYCGAPTFAYEVGGYVVDKNGTVTLAPNTPDEAVERMIQMLYDNGFSGEFESAQEPEIEAGLTVTIPKETLSEGAMANLERLVESKGNLIRKALGVEQLPILITDEAVSFPWFPGEPTADEFKAYTHLVTALCEMARNQKRITAKGKETDNEKYAFRCFLLRLGFIGSEFKAERKILLRNLTGSSAFKSGTKKNAATEGDSCPVSAESEGGNEQCE